MKQTIRLNNIRKPCYPISDNKGNFSPKNNDGKFRSRNPERYVVGIIYEDFNGEMGFFDFWDDYLYRIKEKAFNIIKNGHSSYPSIPTSSNPRIAYLYDTKENKYLGDLLNNEEGHHA
ncbi:MAG: hypothetical protein V3U16_05270 [Candidatus Neomarinimicrobiota bacterium]